MDERSKEPYLFWAKGYGGRLSHPLVSKRRLMRAGAGARAHSHFFIITVQLCLYVLVVLNPMRRRKRVTFYLTSALVPPMRLELPRGCAHVPVLGLGDECHSSARCRNGEGKTYMVARV